MLIPIPEIIQQIRPHLRCLSAATALQEARQNQGVLIDVREPDEAAASAIPAAINIPRGVLEMRMSARYPDPELPIYIHCATGARATLAAEQLQRIGYARVSVITCPLEAITQLSCED